MNKLASLVLLLGFSAFQCNAAKAPDLSESALIGKCNSVKVSIEKYTKLKRKGGNSQQMNRWHKKRNEYKKRYSQLDCKRVRQYLN